MPTSHSQPFPASSTAIFSDPNNPSSKLGLDLPKECLGTPLVIKTSIGPISQAHLACVSFKPKVDLKDAIAWFEGTFDPLGPHHLAIVHELLKFGFGKVRVALVAQNPYKPTAPTAYEHRREMSMIMLRELGLPVAETSDQPGVYVTVDGRDFNTLRRQAIYGQDQFVIVGPDNFDKSMLYNYTWDHDPIINQNNRTRSLFGFRELYFTVPTFRERLLIFPVEVGIHSTDLRNGNVKLPEALTAYTKEHNLYVPGAEAKQSELPFMLPPLEEANAVEVATKLHLIHRLFDISRSIGLGSERVHAAITERTNKLDRLEVQYINDHLAIHDGGASESEPTRLVRFFPSKLPKLMTHVMKAHIQGNYKVYGADKLHELFTSNQSGFFFMNRSGVGSIPAFVHALSSRGANQFARNLKFIVAHDEFSDRDQAFFWNDPNSIIKLDEAGKISPSAQQSILDHLKKPHHFVVVLSSGSGTSMSLQGFNTNLVNSLLPAAYQQSHSMLDGTFMHPELVVAIVGQSGVEQLLAGNNAKIVAPIATTFGKVIELGEFLSATSNYEEPLRGDILGFMVAEFLQPQQLGLFAHSVSVAGDGRVVYESPDAILTAGTIFKTQLAQAWGFDGYKY